MISCPQRASRRVGGTVIWSSLGQTVSSVGAVLFALGPTLLFPLWGAALAVAALGYYDRRRSPCSVCGRGEFSRRYSRPNRYTPLESSTGATGTGIPFST